MLYDCIVIGAGAAGLFAAAQFAEKKILIIEKKDQAGLKVLVSGGGQCNLTHEGALNTFYDKYGDKKKFVKYGLKQFSNEDLIHYLKGLGLTCVTREDGKIFPSTLKAKDVVQLFLRQIEKEPLKQIHFKERVILVKKEGEHLSVKTSVSTYMTKNIIVATGGKSYPALGAEGDGYEIAKSLGHEVVDPRPGLTGIHVAKLKNKDIMGISIKDVLISHYRNEISDPLGKNSKKINQYQGDILFTHFGLSGPVILNNSRYMKANDILKFSLVNRSKEALEQSFFEAVNLNGHLPLSYWLNQLNLQDRLKSMILEQLQMEGSIKLAQINKVLRSNLIRCICEFEVVILQLVDFNQAMVTVGGVQTKEIDERTMCSKLIEHVYFCGEVTDVDGDTGGYNLQWAFTSAYLAVKAITNEEVLNQHK